MIVASTSAGAGKVAADCRRRSESTLHGALHRFVLGSIRDHADSDDLVQETFVRLYAYRSHKTVEDVSAFCFAVARNLIRDRFRRPRSAPDLTDASEDLICPQPGALETMIYRQRVAVLAAAIEAMPPLRREVFLRRRLDGDATATISNDLDLSTAAIEKHVSRAVADLRRALDRRGLWIGDPA